MRTQMNLSFRLRVFCVAILGVCSPKVALAHDPQGLFIGIMMVSFLIHAVVTSLLSVVVAGVFRCDGVQTRSIFWRVALVLLPCGILVGWVMAFGPLAKLVEWMAWTTWAVEPDVEAHLGMPAAFGLVYVLIMTIIALIAGYLSIRFLRTSRSRMRSSSS
jgi:hypothetical protein